MNIGDLDPIVQCEVLRLAHDYAINQRQLIGRREPNDEGEWYGKKVSRAAEKLLSLYEQQCLAK